MASLSVGSAQMPAFLWTLPALPLWPCLCARLPVPLPPVYLVAGTPHPGTPVLASPVTPQDCDGKGSALLCA